MKSIYNTPGFSEELLLVCASLREVGLDNLADQFRAAVFDRSVVDQAIIALRELVKTGLDLLDFPTIAFLQTGYNVYTLQQAARRSWRIGQKHPVRVVFFGYAGSSQITCLQLMAKKIAVAQSTSGDVPESGLDSLNQDGDSVEMALARQLIAA